ncbi:MAG: ATP-dependent RNA helicase RhlE [Phycisphaeraceae bacterium]|nr:MAG: ATP-dependent RNA helicase RhlE [Phycisphaeraceae bacterium]
MTQFSSLDLSQSLLDVIAGEGYETPTPIQAQSIPPVLEGRDLLGCAQTGTGKTAAFALPILQLLLESRAPRKGYRQPRALILSPTRELAGQIEESFRTYGRGSGLRGAVIFGGVKQFRQVRQLEAGVDIIVATPGRLQDLMEQGHVDLRAIEIFVLDEADRMLDMGFIQPIREIASEIPAERQTLLFSATMPSTILKLANSLLNDPVRISVTPDASAAPTIDQELYMVPGEHKPALLASLLEARDVKRAVVFTRTKHGADKLAKKLEREGVRAGSIHGNKSQSQRQRALDAFRAGKSRVLVATDVAARGLDVDGITHVFNYNLPNEPEAYVHRIGRTGRAGATGIAVSFCSREERGFLKAIERLTGSQIETKPLPESLGVVPQDRAFAGRTERPRAARPGGGGGYGGPKRKPRARPQAGGGAVPAHGGQGNQKRKRKPAPGAARGTAAHGGPGAGVRRPKKAGGRAGGPAPRPSRAH